MTHIPILIVFIIFYNYSYLLHLPMRLASFLCPEIDTMTLTLVPIQTLQTQETARLFCVFLIDRWGLTDNRYRLQTGIKTGRSCCISFSCAYVHAWTVILTWHLGLQCRGVSSIQGQLGHFTLQVYSYHIVSKLRFLIMAQNDLGLGKKILWPIWFWVLQIWAMKTSDTGQSLHLWRKWTFWINTA